MPYKNSVGGGGVYFFMHNPSLEGHIRNWQSGAGVREQVIRKLRNTEQRESLMDFLPGLS